MYAVTLADITERLRHLPPEKWGVVYDFISYLAARDLADLATDKTRSLDETLLASEAILARDWNRPEEDRAWAHL